MSWTLISTSRCPPGSFFFELKYKGQLVRIPQPPQLDSPLIGQVADMLADFRRGNRLPRGTTVEALADVIDFTCKRLGNNPEYCIDSEWTAAQAAKVALPTSGCSGCGAKL